MPDTRYTVGGERVRSVRRQQEHLVNLRLLEEIISSAKRRILQILCFLRWRNSLPTTKKPSDLSAEGLVSASSQDNWTPLELFVEGAVKLSVRIHGPFIAKSAG